MKRGRPRTVGATDVLNVRVGQDTLNELELLAAAEGVTKAAVIRQGVRDKALRLTGTLRAQAGYRYRVEVVDDVREKPSRSPEEGEGCVLLEASRAILDEAIPLSRVQALNGKLVLALVPGVAPRLALCVFRVSKQLKPELLENEKPIKETGAVVLGAARLVLGS